MDETSARHWMELAIEEMQSCTELGPSVGAVIVKDGALVAQGHRTQNAHAERSAIESALSVGIDLSGATLFTTLEPCVTVSSKKEPCSTLISRVGITTVYIGRYDPNPSINRLGWKALRDSGVTLRDFAPDLRMKIDSINEHFVEHFTSGIGPRGGAKFDYQLNGGKFEIQFSNSDERSIVTQWTHRGPGSIYAYAVRPVTVALAKFAEQFGEVDDPSSLDFTYTVPVAVGEIAVFLSPSGAVLVHVVGVEVGPASGASRRFVKIVYEVRPNDA